MKKFITILAVFALSGLLMYGCSDRQNPIDPSQNARLTLANRLSLASASDLVSATFYIYVTVPSNQQVNVHRITSPWEEMTVTWNSFGGSFAPAVEGSFLADAIGWESVDLTSLMGSWLNGTYSNYGILLDQEIISNSRTTYFSRDNSIYQPYFVICYNTDAGIVCDTIIVMADTEIYETNPDDNYGWSIGLRTGYVSPYALEKQSLLWIDVPVIPELASIGDYVWRDADIDGIQDEGEEPVEGVTVHLLDCDGNILASTTTNASGYYLFDELEAGDYKIQFILPEGYAFSPYMQGGNPALDSDADPSTGITACTTLEAGEHDMTWDAGIYRPVHTGCTLTIGFWKTHAGFGPQEDVVTPLLPIWLGTPAGSRSLHVTTAAMAVDILSHSVYGTSTNGITKLYAQLLGAKLNIADGADYGDVAEAIAAADAFLASYNWTNWTTLSRSQRAQVLLWMNRLDLYNNGDIGPGHCDWVVTP